MSLFKLDKTYFDTFKVLAKPKRTFSSSSSGVVGAIPVFPGASTQMKEVVLSFSDNRVDYETAEALRQDIIKTGVKKSSMEEYLTAVNKETANARLNKQVEILRFEPSFRFTTDTVRKSVIKNVLYPYYRQKYGKACNWAFTNYNSLNFFSTSDNTVPQDAVLIYPATGSYKYRPTGSFSFEFYINPRYHEFTRAGEFPAGTLLHLSSSFAVSLVSGSSRDHNGFVDGYRLMLQLSHSAEIEPSQCSLGLTDSTRSAPYDFIFSSSDNSLNRNTWHHCCIRWDNNTQNSTGSFVIDGVTKGTFDIPSSALSGSYLQRELPSLVTRDGIACNLGPPDALFVGNFYVGPNSTDPSGDEDFTAQFFNTAVAQSDGIYDYYGAAGSGVPDPDDFSFTHPLNAEVHELKIYNRYRNDLEIQDAMNNGVQSLSKEKSGGLLFYLPPFFVKDTNTRDILQTPFQTSRGSTDDPFNVPLSFGVGGHYLNLENFTKEFVEGVWPRLFALSGSTINTSTGWTSANNFLFSTGSVRKRNLTILPNDNGLFIPNFGILEQDATDLSSEGSLSLFVDDLGRKDLSLVNLSVLLPTASVGRGLLGTESEGSISTALQGPTPDDPSVPAGSILTIYNRTRDPSSNEVAIFDASNLFYGNKIDPGTYKITDSAITGSGGRVAISLSDHSGSLYRADCLSPHAKWNSVGTMLYEEGIATVQTPLIPRFGIDQFEISFDGQQNIHVLRIDVPAERGSLSMSSNPSYTSLSPSDQPADKNMPFCYITNVNLLDENLNVISKTNFSQALVKRENDRFVVRIKLDF
jgi:hypothetical protein